MAKKQKPIQIPLFSNQAKPKKLKEYVQGENLELDTFELALKSYINDLSLSERKVSLITAIGRSTVSRITSGKHFVNYDYLCAICIALRLHPARQRYIFGLIGYLLPDRKDKALERNHIIQGYLDSCAFIESYTLEACNKELKDSKEKPLTKLFERR